MAPVQTCAQICLCTSPTFTKAATSDMNAERKQPRHNSNWKVSCLNWFIPVVTVIDANYVKLRKCMATCALHLLTMQGARKLRNIRRYIS